MSTHDAHGAAVWNTWPLAAVVAATAVYVLLAWRQRAGGRTWSGWRIAACVAGGGMLALALSPEALPFARGDFREHMLQHLLIGMLAPLALVLSAPMTLLLRSLGRRGRQVLGRILRCGYVRLVTNPVVALALNLGGMAALYFTPLYGAMMRDPALHLLVHVHFLGAGYLFAWVIAGPDPAPHRPSVRFRLVLLGVAIAVHAALSQLLYAGAFVAVDVPEAARRGGAEIMYYGGDIAELLLAFALVGAWRPRRARREASRATSAAPPFAASAAPFGADRS